MELVYTISCMHVEIPYNWWMLYSHHDFLHNSCFIQFFSPQEQYQMVFEAVLAYLGSFDTYANFQNIWLQYCCTVEFVYS